MSNIGGEKRENPVFESEGFAKKVGLFEAKVIAVNPTTEEYADILGRELKEDSKATNYLGTSKDGNARLRIDFWLEEVKSRDKYKLTFFIENKEKENKDGTKKQYINNVGRCTWALFINQNALDFSGLRVTSGLMRAGETVFMEMS